MIRKIRNFIRDESGMEMIEWTIVAVVFGVAAATFWTQLGGAINSALQLVAGTVTPGGVGGGGGS